MQEALYARNAVLSKKDRLAQYKTAVKQFDRNIKVSFLTWTDEEHSVNASFPQITSDKVIGELALHGTNASAYKMALECSKLSLVVFIVSLIEPLCGSFGRPGRHRDGEGSYKNIHKCSCLRGQCR